MSKLVDGINERLINEYISKVGCCDECFASTYCTVNGLRETRVPQDYCVKNIKRYFGDNAKMQKRRMTKEEIVQLAIDNDLIFSVYDDLHDIVIARMNKLQDEVNAANSDLRLIKKFANANKLDTIKLILEEENETDN